MDNKTGVTPEGFWGQQDSHAPGVTPEGVKSGNFSGWLGKGNWRWHNDPSDEFQAAYLCLLEMGPKDSHIKIFWRSTVKQNAINSPCFQVCDGMDQFCWAI